MRVKQFPLAVAALALCAFGVQPHGAGGQSPARSTDGGASMLVRSLDAASVLPAEPAPASALGGAAVDAAAAERELLVSSALEAFSARVPGTSDPAALRDAFTAYYGYRWAHPERVRKPYLYFVDYGLAGRAPRGWVLDMDALRVVDGPFTVAHGRGSGGRNEVPSYFSNRSGSAASSLGLFLAAESYDFTGTSGGRHYSSVGMRLDGLSGAFNDDARARRVVVHGAPYVTPAGTGRSEGCPAMERQRARRLIPLLSGGSLVFLFSPRDTAWLRGDPWVNGR